MVVTEKLRIGGMTCINCENRITQVLQSVDGIQKVYVSYERGEAEITYQSDQITHDKIVAIIEVLDYRVLLGKDKEGSKLSRVVSLLAVIVVLYGILQATGLLNLLVPGQLGQSGMGYGMLFIIGLMTSVHCIAMCGGINLSQCIPRKPDDSQEEVRPFLPALLYNLGRVVSYTVIGLLLGTVGFLAGGVSQNAGMSMLLQGILKIVAGLFMIIMGINMLDLFPWLKKLTFRVPRFISRGVNRKRVRYSQPFLVGLLNGLMPCGPLQSMWLVAVATANPLAGALSMFLFSLGTVPLMLGLGSLVSALGQQSGKQVRLVGSVLVVVLGLAMISQGGLLSGWLSPDLLWTLIVVVAVCGILLSVPSSKKAVNYALRAASVCLIVGTVLVWNVVRNGVTAQAAADEAVKSDNTSESEGENNTLEDGVQVVYSTLERGSYPTITVEAGIPVRWIIDAPEGSINGCNYRMYIDAYDIVHTFEEGENVIEFTPDTAGNISYNCWMGMIYGTIRVVESEDDAQEETTEEVEIDWDSLPKLSEPCCE